MARLSSPHPSVNSVKWQCPMGFGAGSDGRHERTRSQARHDFQRRLIRHCHMTLGCRAVVAIVAGMAERSDLDLGRVLVVDDNQQNVLLIRGQLEREGYL